MSARSTVPARSTRPSRGSAVVHALNVPDGAKRSQWFFERDRMDRGREPLRSSAIRSAEQRSRIDPEHRGHPTNRAKGGIDLTRLDLL
jgi:hypothetical protein